MLFSSGEKTDFAKISLMYAISYSILLILGTLSMAFWNFWLGFVLFVLGLALVIGNEALSYRQIAKKQKAMPYPSPLGIISEGLGFALVAYFIPLLAAAYIFITQGLGNEVIIIALAGICATSVKIAAKTAQLLIAK